MDLLTDMFNKYFTSPLSVKSISQLTFHFFRLQQSCLKKCVPKTYLEGEINKGEGVCIDRCVAKFFDVQLKVSELMQAEAAAKGASGGGFGIGGGM